MSIEILKELDDEVRRLFIAGSKLAPGDLRLGRLQPPLQKLGESAPVFARVAQAVERTIDPKASSPSAGLLELAMLLNSILYTQGQTESRGDSVPLQGTENFTATSISFRKLNPVWLALTRKGPGRLEVIRQACEEGLFRDYRLMIPAVAALDESFPEIADFVEMQVVPQFGHDVLPVLREQLRLDGGKGDARRLQLIHRLLGTDGIALYLQAAGEGSPEVRVAAIALLGHYPEQESFVLEQTQERRKEVRRAALAALARIGTARASDRIYEALVSKDRELAIEPIQKSRDMRLVQRVIDYADSVCEQLKQGRKDEETTGQLLAALESLRGSRAEGIFELLRSILADKAFSVQETSRLQEIAAQLLVGLETPEAQAFAVSLKETHKNKFLDYSFQAAVQSLSPEEVYNRFASYFTDGPKSAGKLLLQVFYQLVPTVYEQMTEKRSLPPDTFDPRWVDVFIKIDEVELVSRLARTPDKQTVSYLKSKCGGTAGFGSNPVIHACLALFHIGYKEAPEVLVEAMTPAAYRSCYYLYEPHAFLLKLLPGMYAQRLANFAEEGIPYESVRKQVLEIADFIRAKPPEAQAEQGGWVKWITSKLF